MSWFIGYLMNWMKNGLKLKLSVLYQISTKSKRIELITVWLMLVDWFVNKHININHSNDIIEIMKKDHQNEINFNPSRNQSINERESKNEWISTNKYQLTWMWEKSNHLRGKIKESIHFENEIISIHSFLFQFNLFHSFLLFSF